jgi:ATP-dependent Clp protease adaptor protein ClpS
MASLPRSGGRGTPEEPYELPDEPDELPAEEETYDLVLLNDDTHSFEYVITLLHDLFGVSWDTGYGMAETIDYRGERVLFTGTRPEVELKRAEVLAYGPDRWTGTAEPLGVEIRRSLSRRAADRQTRRAAVSDAPGPAPRRRGRPSGG